MAVVGRKPKDGPKRNRNAPTHDWLEVDDVPFEGSPDLPAWVEEWQQVAVDWYEIVRRLPHAALWDDGDWNYVHQTALSLHRSIEGAVAHAVEFRLREKEIAVTSPQRRDQRIRYVEPVEKTDDESPGLVLAMPPRLTDDLG